MFPPKLEMFKEGKMFKEESSFKVLSKLSSQTRNHELKLLSSSSNQAE